MIAFLLVAYCIGAVVGATNAAFQTWGVAIGTGVVGFALIVGVRRVLVNSLRAFFYSSIVEEANRLNIEHSEEALTLLSKEKHEDLKVHLVKRLSDSDDAIRALRLRENE
jgi:hypothetical protein